MVTNDWRIWLAGMAFFLVLLVFFCVCIWWNDKKMEKNRKQFDKADTYTKAEDYYLCVFLKDGGCDLHRASDVKQVVSSASKDYYNVVLRDDDVTHYEDVVSYEFMHIRDLTMYNLKTLKRITVIGEWK